MPHYFYFLSFLFVTGFISLSQIHAADGDRPSSAARASCSSPSPGEREIYTHHPKGRWNKEWLEGQRESAAPAISNKGLDYYLSDGREGIFRTIIDRLYAEFLVGLGHEESLPYDPLEFVLHNDREIAKKSDYARLLRAVNQYLWFGKYFRIAQMPEAFERPSSSHARCMATVIRANEESPGKETLAKLYEANTPIREDRVVLIAHLAVVATVHYEATRVYYPSEDRVTSKGNIIWALDREENKIVLKSEPEAPLNLLDLVTKLEGWKEEINRAFLEAKNLIAREDAPTREPIRTRRHSIASPGESTMPRTSPRRFSVTASASGPAGISLATAVTARGQVPVGESLNFFNISAIAQRSESINSLSSVGSIFGQETELEDVPEGEDEEEQAQEEQTLGKEDTQTSGLPLHASAIVSHPASATTPHHGGDVPVEAGVGSINGRGATSSQERHRITPEDRKKWISALHAPSTPAAAANEMPSTPPGKGQRSARYGEQVMGETKANGYAQLSTPPRRGRGADPESSRPLHSPAKGSEAGTALLAKPAVKHVEEEGCCCVVM